MPKKWYASGQFASNVPCVQSVQMNVNLEESQDSSVVRRENTKMSLFWTNQDATDLTQVHSNGQLVAAAIGQEVKMKFFGQRSVGTNVVRSNWKIEKVPTAPTAHLERGQNLQCEDGWQ